MNILITGGTGLIGKRLSNFLLQSGMYPALTSRRPVISADIPQYHWNIQEGKIDAAAFKQVDAIVHLAGANIAEGRWTAKRKKEILDSRVQSTRLLIEAIKKINPKKRPKIVVSASATGYYGIQDFEHESTEENKAGQDFLAQVCEQWEEEADHLASLGMRVVKVRTGVVMDKEGGALPKITQPIRYLAGSPLGSGRQYINWIHWKDWCAAVHHLLIHEEQSGSYNLVAPNPVTNANLTRLIARTIQRPLWLPNVPGFVIKLLFGEMSSVVLEGHKVSSKKLEETGYQFMFTEADEAIRDLLGQH